MTSFQNKIDIFYSRLLRLYFSPYYRKIGREDIQILKKFEEFQFFDESEIAEWKFEKIRKLLWFCSKYVPYYQNLFSDQNININNIKDLEDFQEKIPILRKKDIRQNYNKLIAKKTAFPPIKKNSTGGSTGEPINFYIDRYDLSYMNASSLLNLKWCGWNLWEKRAYLWGASRDSQHSKLNLMEKRLKNRIILNSFYMNNQDMYDYYFKIRNFQPKIIIGYANSLFLFSKFLKRYNFDFKDLNLSVQSSAETLFPEMRKSIEISFGSNVFNSYGSREISSIAHECHYHNGLHVNELVNHLEIIPYRNSKNLHNFGKIIVTSLTNYIFPFIRYENDDIGIIDDIKKCRCSRSFRKLKKIIGRSTDFIQTPSGNIIHGEYFTHLFYHQDFIMKFQLIQETINYIIVKYIISPDRSKNRNLLDFLNEVELKFKQECDPLLEISFLQVNDIKPLKSGKDSFITSKLKSLFSF